MNEQLSIKQQQMVLDNRYLVNYLVKRLGIIPDFTTYDDLVSIGTMGLIKAASTFDESKEIKFITYASKCIHNEIFMFYKKAKKYSNDISLEGSISQDSEGNELTLSDVIEHPKSDFIKEIIDTESFIKLVSIILNYLQSRERVEILYRLGDACQKDIAEKFNISQSYISRIEKKAIKKIQRALKNQVHYEEVFSMEVMGDVYKITFASKDISNFNRSFAKVLQNVKSVETLPDFKVKRNKERIIIQVPADLSSFSFIAQIIQEIDDFSMEYVSNKNILSANNTGLQKVEANATFEKDSEVKKIESTTIEQIPAVSISNINEVIGGVDTGKITEKHEIEQETSNVSTTTIEQAKETVTKNQSAEDSTYTPKEDTISTVNTDLAIRKGNQVKEVREYMLSIESFTIKDLKQHFPNLTKGTINNAVYLAKRKKLITNTDKGKYVVNKN